MKANELRIGNLIKSGTGIYKIFAMSIPQILAIQKYNEPEDSQLNIYQSDNTIIEPIPLTDEWLEKLGALKDEYGDVFIEVDSDSDMRLYLSTKGYIQLVKSHHCPMFDYEHIKFIHQLQNLFFALTGEELTIKEATK